MDESELEELCRNFFDSDLHLRLLETVEKDLASATAGSLVTSSAGFAAAKDSLLDRLNTPETRRSVINWLFAASAKLPKRQYQQQPQQPAQSHLAPVGEAAHISRAQANWEKRICKSLNQMCNDLGLPLARRRTEKDFNALMTKWNELSVLEKDVSSIRPVYASKDFLEVLVAVRCPNALAEVTDTRWGLIHAPLRCKTISQLRLDYHDLAIGLSQTGVDDECLPDGDIEREKFAVKVLETGNAPLAQEFSKRGVPLSYRGRLWSLIFDVSVNGYSEQYLQGLKQAVLDHDLLVDALIFKDIKLTAANNDMYFVFEDYLHMVLLMFSRDPAVLDVYRRCCATAPKAYLNGRVGDEASAVAYPPSGVIPFHGFALLLCPLCFLYSDPKELYLVFRELYTRQFYKLHVISSESDSILGLCALFESLLQTHEPELFHHLRSEGIQPLRIAFRWMMLAFSGLLLPEQVLLLWDRIVAYDSLTILPLFAVGVFSFRKHNLLQAKSFSAAEAVLSDLTTLSVGPIMQLTLFARYND